MTTPHEGDRPFSSTPATESSPIGDELFGDPAPDTTSPDTTATFGTGGAHAGSFGDAGSSDDGGTREKAEQTAETAKQNAGEVAGTARDEAAQVAGEAKDAAADLLAQARGHVDEQSRSQLQGLAAKLGELGDELDEMVRGSSTEGTVTELARQLGDRTHALSRQLADREPKDLLGDVRGFASRRPGTFIVGALAAGLVAGRVTRAVQASQSDSTSGTSGTAGSTGSVPPSGSTSPAFASPAPTTGGTPPPTVGGTL